MTPESRAALTQLVALCDQLLSRLRASQDPQRERAAVDAFASVIKTVSVYRHLLAQAFESTDTSEALRAANRTSTVNKGLSDEGLLISGNTEIREIGENITAKSRVLAKSLRQEMGMSF